jgi:hypothetical protein
MDMNSVLDLKPFLPAKEYAVAKQFYLDLGFTIAWEGDQLAAFQVGEFRFLLQNNYVKEWARQLHDAPDGQGRGRMVAAHTRQENR